MARSVMWFRRDLRIADNRALAAAADAGDEVVPVFVVDDQIWRAAGPNRRSFLCGCLAELNDSLDDHLFVTSGSPRQAIPQIAEALKVDRVFCTGDTTPYAAERDDAVARALGAVGARLESVDSPFSTTAGSVRTKGGDPYRVFTPFYRAWLDAVSLDSSATLELALARPSELGESVRPSATPTATDLAVPGEEAAHRSLEGFLAGPARDYAAVRDRPDLDATSRLSPYLHFGCLHPRQILSRLDLTLPGHEEVARQIAWRDFYGHVVAAFADSTWNDFNPRVAVRTDAGSESDARFAAWRDGRTGYPFVDAGMRQLSTEGWMHNRARMVTASFLVKDLHVDWRRGARHFLDHLVDGDIASNNHGWQWVAGTGTDAAPYHRIFNPVTQAKRFDPDGTYVRRFVPELRQLDSRTIHEPWKDPSGLPTGYPPPIVDHAAEREEALRRYRQR